MKKESSIGKWLNEHITLNIKLTPEQTCKIGADMFGDIVTVCGKQYFIYCNTIHDVGIIDWFRYHYCKIMKKPGVWRYPM